MSKPWEEHGDCPTFPAGRGSSFSLVCREPVTAGVCSLLLPSSAVCAWFGDLFARCFLFAFQHFVVHSPLFIPAASCHHGPPADVWRHADQSPGDSLTLFCRANGNGLMKLVKPIDPLANFSIFLLRACRCGISLAISNPVGRTQGQLVFNTHLNVKCVLCHQDADSNFPDEDGQDQVPVNAVAGFPLAALLRLVSSLAQHPCLGCPRSLHLEYSSPCCSLLLPERVCTRRYSRAR